MAAARYAMLGALFLSLLVAISCFGVPDRAGGTSRVVLGVAASAQDMEGITGVQLNVAHVSLRGTNGVWIDVPLLGQSFDLIELSAHETAFPLADTSIATGRYDRMRCALASVSVSDIDGAKEGKLAASVMEFPVELDVVQRGASSTLLIIDARSSLRRDADGVFVLSPRLRVETRSNAQVLIDEEGALHISGGTVHTDAAVS